MLVIRNAEGEVIRRIPAPHGKGFHRVNWDMRHPSAGALNASRPPKRNDPKGPAGFLAVPGSYSASLVLLQEGQVQWTQGPVSFELKPLRKGALEGSSMEEVDAFEKLGSRQRSERPDQHGGIGLGQAGGGPAGRSRTQPKRSGKYRQSAFCPPQGDSGDEDQLVW